MPKRTQLTNKPIPIRIDAATRANLDLIIESGIAKDTSAALRAGAAALARGLVADPRVWVVHQDGFNQRIFATEDSARAWLIERGASETDVGWITHDDDHDIDSYYDIEPIVPL